MESETEVTVKVLFFASARELTGLGEATCEITANITPQNLLKKIVSSFSLDAIAQNLILSLNEEWVSGNTSLFLQPNDVIAVIPPLSGGEFIAATFYCLEELEAVKAVEA